MPFFSLADGYILDDQNRVLLPRPALLANTSTQAPYWRQASGQRLFEGFVAGFPFVGTLGSPVANKELES